MTETDAFFAIAWPALLGLLAVGAVLLIKIARRRQGAARGAIGDLVPTRPMSRDHAQRLRRRYLWVVALVVGTLVILGLLLLA